MLGHNLKAILAFLALAVTNAVNMEGLPAAAGEWVTAALTSVIGAVAVWAASNKPSSA